MNDLFGNEIQEPNYYKSNKKGLNPMVVGYGKGPDNTRCKTCQHLYVKKLSKKYYKCELRGKPTNGPATDHKVNWPACKKYVKSEE